MKLPMNWTELDRQLLNTSLISIVKIYGIDNVEALQYIARNIVLQFSKNPEKYSAEYVTAMKSLVEDVGYLSGFLHPE